jgi:hypothetical protein
VSAQSVLLDKTVAVIAAHVGRWNAANLCATWDGKRMVVIGAVNSLEDFRRLGW